MSQILKAKNRIMNRSKTGSSQQQIMAQQNQPEHSSHGFKLEQTFDLQPVTYNKKFNISTISMKFTKQQSDQQQSNSYIQERYETNKIRIPQQQLQQSIRRQKSPEFSRTQRINPIRHFQPFHLNTLSESNSNSSLYNKWAKTRSRRLVSTQSQNFQFQEKKSDAKMILQKNQGSLAIESPIRKIRKTVHGGQSRILIAKEEKRRAQSPFKPRECVKEYTQNRIRQVLLKGKPFDDDQFPAKPTIVFPKKSLYEQQPNLSFERLSKLYQARELQPVLLQTCQPTLLSPGQFTNPYIYSAIRILAQNPQRILSIFQSQQLNQQGIYYVRLCKDGTWRYVIVDDCVPVRTVKQGDKKNTQLLGLSCMEALNNVEIWPALIQKALAKVYGTYYDLILSRRDGVSPIFRLLTGFPVSKYDLIKDVRSYLVLIDSAIKRQHVIILQQILPQFRYLAELKGLSIQQSYQVIQIQKNSFVLRNLADLELVTKLTFDEVMMFSSLLIFRKQENYTYVSQKLRHKKGYFSSVRVHVGATTQCYWDVWQNNPAYYKSHLQNKISYQVAPYKILIQPLSQQSTPLSYDSIQQPEAIVQSGKQITLKKGEYLVSVHLCQVMQEMDFTLSYYGEKDVEIQRVKNKIQKWTERCCQDANNKQKLTIE